MSVKIVDTAGSNELQIDVAGCAKVKPGLQAIGAAGGYYTVTGGSTAVVAAALAANTSLMSMRMSGASARKAYVVKMRFNMTPATLGAAAGVAGSLAIQRFNTATPTGGNARTANRMNLTTGTTTDITDIRDSNAALTVTSVVFTTYVAQTQIPLFVASAGGFEWIFEPEYPVILDAGEGLVLRTIVALAATQTWMYSYTFHWHEE